MSKKKSAGGRKRKPVVPDYAKGEIMLAIDSSSVAVGWAVFADGELLEYGKYLQQGSAHGEKLMNYRAWLIEAFEKLKPDLVIVEVPYAGRRSNAYGILSFYLAILLEAYFQVFRQELPEYGRLAAHAIKRICKMPKAKDHEGNKKAAVLLVNQLYGLQLHYKSNDKTKKITEDDTADAILAGHAFLLKTGRIKDG